MHIPRTTHMARHVRRGMSLAEVLVVLAIVGTLALLGFGSLRAFLNHEQLETATHNTYTTLVNARSATLASEESTTYGVRIDETQIVRFAGTVFDPTDTSNQVVDLNGVVATTTIDGATVHFAAHTGSTADSGTILLTHPGTGATSTVTVHQSGLIATP